MFVFDLGIFGLIKLALLGFQLFAVVDAAVRPAEAYLAAGKWTKPAWLIVLGLAASASLLMRPLSFIVMLGLVASIVYVVDARPAVRALGRGRPNRGRSW